MPNVQLAYQIERIEIVDKRKNVSTGHMKIPKMSTRKSYLKHFPAVTSEHQEEIENFCKNNIKGSGPSVKVTINLIDAYKEFSATMVSEREKGHVEMEILLYDLSSGTQLIFCQSTGSFQIESLDADEEKIEKVYQYSLRQAIYQCFRSIASSSARKL